MKQALILLVLLCATRSRAAELRLGLDVESAELRRRPVVLVYLSNDTLNPHRTEMTQIKLWLQAVLLGEQYEKNKTDKPAFTDEEISFFQRLPPEDKAFLAELEETVRRDDLVHATKDELEAIYRNTLVSNPRFWLSLATFRTYTQEKPLGDGYLDFLSSRPPAGDLTKGSISHAELPKEALTFPYADQAISHLGVLEKLLDAVYRLFPADEYRFVLVLKSYGGGNKVLSPVFDTNVVQELSFSKVVGELVKRKAELRQGQASVPTHRGTNLRLSRILRELAGKKEASGISVEQVMDLLSKTKAQFPLVFFDVNELQIPDSVKIRERFPNIGSVFYTDRKVPSAFVSYTDLFRYIGVATTDFEVRFRDVLRETLK